MVAMEDFVQSCHRADEYPNSLLSIDTPLSILNSIEAELDRRAGRLFGDQSSSAVDFLELRRSTQDPSKILTDAKRINSLDGLEQQLQSWYPEPSSLFV